MKQQISDDLPRMSPAVPLMVLAAFLAVNAVIVGYAVRTGAIAYLWPGGTGGHGHAPATDPAAPLPETHAPGGSSSP